METTKKLNETPLIQQMTDKHTYIIVDDQGNVSRVKDVAKEYVTETELNDFIEPYDERITTNETDIVNTKTDVLDLETYIDIVTPKNTASGELVHVNDALPLPTQKTKSSGNVEQETTKGNQLFDCEDIENTTSNITINKEGWVTATLDNTNGTSTKWVNYWTNVSNKLKTSTSYKIVVEVKNISGTFKEFAPVSINTSKDSQFTTQQLIVYSKLTNNTIYLFDNTTKDDFTNSTNMLRSFIAFDAGESGSITFRLSVIEDTTVTPETFVYEKYTGGQASPNPDCQQPIEMLEAYNLFNSFIATKSQHQPVGELQIEKDGTIILSGNTGSNNYFALNQTLGELCPDLKVGDTAYLYLETTSAVKNIYIGEAWIHDGAKTITQTMLDKSVVIYGGYNQVDKIKIQVSKKPNKKYVPYNHISYKVYSENLYENSQDFSGVWSNNAEWLTHDETYNGLVVKKRLRAWTGIYKRLSVEKGKTYTFSVYVKSDSDKNTAIYISGGTATVTSNNKSIKTTSSWTRESLTFTATSDGTVSPRLENLTTIDGNYTYICGYQLEEGPNVTDYKPYKEQIVYLDLKGNWVGKINDTIKDYLVTDKKKYWLVKNVEKGILSFKRIWAGDKFKFAFFDKPVNQLGYDTWSKVPIMSEISNNSITDKEFAITTSGSKTENALELSLDSTLTIKELKALADGKPFYYPTATTEIIELGELPEPIKTFEGVNNIQLLANLDTEIEVVYAQDVKKYIDSKLAEISAQII